MRDFTLFLKKEKLLFEGQYGFRNKRSTTDVLTDITERIRDVCDKGYYAYGAFLDFRKAFNTANHEILLSKLTHYGIEVKLLTGSDHFYLKEFNTHQ